MDIQAMMEAYERLGTPGEQHKLLAKMAGSWEAKVKNWIEPGATPIESSGTSEKKQIMGGRFLQEEFSGSMLGNQFNGLSITGFDNHAKQYESIWIDSTSTSILLFQGIALQDRKKITMECSHADMIRGPMKWRSETTLIDDTTHFFEMFSIDQSGKSVKNMEITYTCKR